MNQTPSSIDLSIVIPAYNEGENLAGLLAELDRTLTASPQRYEILVIDDGSTDGSDRILRDLRRAHPCLRVIGFRHNAGQTAALDAGFRRARGEILVTLDADLQYDPADIPVLLQALEGWDAVVGFRRVRNDRLIRRVSSRIANFVRNRLSHEKIADTGCSLKAYRRAVLERITLYDGMHRFLPTLLRMQGFRVKELPVRHRPRTRGNSKYGIGNRLWPSFVDLLVVRWMKKRKLRYEVKDEDPANS